MRTKATLPASITAAVLFVVAFVALQSTTIRPGATDAIRPLPSEDAVRIGVVVRPIDGAGLITKDAASAGAMARWEDKSAIGDPFLQLMTDPDTARSDEPITDRPVWVVRYSGLKVVSPGGRELHYAYVVIDARTGLEIHTKWAE